MSQLGSLLRLDGKSALITGGSRGIGLAIACAYRQAGANVCITGRKQQGLDSAQRELERIDAPGRVLCQAASVTTAAGSEGAVAHHCEVLGSLDILVNNAGTNPALGPLHDIDLGAWRKTYEVNLQAPLAMAQAAWRASMRKHGGVIINIGSVGVHVPTPFLGAYTGSKSSLLHLSRQLAGEMAPDVRVLCISPGLVKTQLSRALWEGREEEMARTTLMHRLGTPEDIAHAALFAASKMASWMSAVELIIDGGSRLIALDPQAQQAGIGGPLAPLAPPGPGQLA